MNNKIKILITGANGQLGKEIARQLKKKESNYLALSRKKLDITDFNAVQKTIKNFQPNFVINCAAYNAVDRAEKDWRLAFLANGIGVKNLALACNEINSTLIHFSSDFVFDGEKDSSYTIADNPSPINKYGESKYLGEKFIQDLSAKYYLIRLSWVFGDNSKASFPLKLIEWAKKNKVLKIVNDQISSPSFVEDISRAVFNLIKTNQYGLYHLTNQGFCSKYEWAKYILKKINWPGKIVPVKSQEFKTPARRPKFSVLDNFPLEQTIKYKLPPWQEATDQFLKKNITHKIKF